MEFTMNRDALLHAAQVAAKVTARASTQAMACALVEASDGDVSFSATDGEQAVTHADMAMVTKDGACMVPAQALARVVKSLRDGAVTVTAGDGSVAVECGKSRFELPSLPAAQWQGMPSECDGPSCTLPAEDLQDMAKRVTPFADAGKDSREWSKGVNVVFDGDRLTMQATDSYRIGECWHDADGKDAFAALVPAEFISSAAGAMCGDVRATSDGNRFMLACDGTRMSTRAIAVKFPNIARMWPDKPRFELEFATADLASAMGRAAQLGNHPVDIDAANGQMRVHVNESGVGQFEESVPCEGEYSGCASLAFLKACIDAMDEPRVRAMSAGDLAPIAIYGSSVRACVMPIRRGA